MAAKKGSPLGTCLTTLFTSLLAPVLVNVVSGAIHPADNTTSPAQPVAARRAAQTSDEVGRGNGAPGERLPRRDGWDHPNPQR